MIIILLGAPGAGKGTIAKLIVNKWQIPQISTGDILRKNIAKGTFLGKQAKKFIDTGDLVPDNLILVMVKERFQEEDCLNGFILDGFPRTIKQANDLDDLLKGLSKEITATILVDVPYDEIKRRISGRRTCSNENCQSIYNIFFNPTKFDGICDKCNSSVIQRSDETDEVVGNRLKIYEEKTAPLIEYYGERGLLKRFTGSSSKEIFDKIKKSYLKEFFRK